MNLKPIEINYLLSLLDEEKRLYLLLKSEIKRSARIEAKLNAELAYQKEIKKEAKI